MISVVSWTSKVRSTNDISFVSMLKDTDEPTVWSDGPSTILDIHLLLFFITVVFFVKDVLVVSQTCFQEIQTAVHYSKSAYFCKWYVWHNLDMIICKWDVTIIWCVIHHLRDIGWIVQSIGFPKMLLFHWTAMLLFSFNGGIGGSRGRTPGTLRMDPILSFSHTFSPKSTHVRGPRPLREILNPPLEGLYFIFISDSPVSKCRLSKVTVYYRLHWFNTTRGNPNCVVKYRCRKIQVLLYVRNTCTFTPNCLLMPDPWLAWEFRYE